jgi:hypothetical protein
VGKTTWLNKLCPDEMKEFLICSHINPSLTDQNTANFLAEKWFVNVDDQLETIFGKDFNSMKAIITAPFVTNRKTWHRWRAYAPFGSWDQDCQTEPAGLAIGQRASRGACCDPEPAGLPLSPR